MCSYRLYKANECNCKWLKIRTPCSKGKGFSTCSRFEDGTWYAEKSKQYWANKEDCPWHGLRGAYDGNEIRMVEKMNAALPVGVICCVVM